MLEEYKVMLQKLNLVYDETLLLETDVLIIKKTTTEKFKVKLFEI
jgi:hypothetical protein